MHSGIIFIKQCLKFKAVNEKFFFIYITLSKEKVKDADKNIYLQWNKTCSMEEMFTFTLHLPYLDDALIVAV